MAEPWPPYSSSSRGKKKRPRSPNDDATSSQGRTENSTSLGLPLSLSNLFSSVRVNYTLVTELAQVCQIGHRSRNFHIKIKSGGSPRISTSTPHQRDDYKVSVIMHVNPLRCLLFFLLNIQA